MCMRTIIIILTIILILITITITITIRTVEGKPNPLFSTLLVIRTEDARWDHVKDVDSEANVVAKPVAAVDPLVHHPAVNPHTISDPAATKPADNTVGTKKNDTTPKEKTTKKSSWGWGSVRRRQANDSSESSLDGDAAVPVATSAVAAASSPTTEVGLKESAKTVGKNNNLQLEPGTTYRIEMSLCGFSAFGSGEDENAKVFEEHQISYDKFMHNPNVLNKPSLVFRYENRYYAAGAYRATLHITPPISKAARGRKSPGAACRRRRRRRRRCV